MKPRLVDLLACPLDGGPLELVEWASRPAPLGDEDVRRIRRMGLRPERFEREITSGLLLNRRRRVYYPILDGVPRLLPFRAGVVRDFQSLHRSRIAAELPGFAPPAEQGMPGEEATLRSFSREWLAYEWDERAYWGQPAEALFRSMRWALDLEIKQLAGRLVLEVGIGIGGIADDVARTQGCELVGIDLSHAVDAAYRAFGDNPFFHIVQASAFAPPFVEGTFDYVYTHGVLHHTFSTRAAFNSIGRLPRVGARLYAWVYGKGDDQRTLLRRFAFRAEGLLRPIYARLPEKVQTIALVPWAPLYILHQCVQARSNPHLASYGWREAMHAARDRWTPRYVHRHTDDQVAAWFTAAGYDDLTFISQRERPPYVPVGFVTCVGIEGTRRR